MDTSDARLSGVEQRLALLEDRLRRLEGARAAAEAAPEPAPHTGPLPGTAPASPTTSADSACTAESPALPSGAATTAGPTTSAGPEGQGGAESASGGADAHSDLPPEFWILEGLRTQAGGQGGAVAYAGMLSDGSVQWQYQRPADHVLALDFADSAAQLAAIGSPVRMQILQAVLAGADSVARLSDLPDMGSSGQLYHHLNQLTGAGWLVSPRRGRWEVPAERIIPLLTIVLATQR
jgi:DNA-binding transcriptional ArsR family regulator